MSRSNNTEIANPSKVYYEWSGAQGNFKYFDKERGEKGERVTVPLPFKFIVLDTLSTIKGYSDADKSGFWSNEVRDIKKDELTVKTRQGIAARGVYENVNQSRDCRGAKYCQSVYIGAYIDNKLTICNIWLDGAAMSAWIDFRKQGKIY